MHKGVVLCNDSLSFGSIIEATFLLTHDFYEIMLARK